MASTVAEHIAKASEVMADIATEPAADWGDEPDADMSGEATTETTQNAEVSESTNDSTTNGCLRLQDFLGEWRDSMGHEVRVRWAPQGNAAGELDVQLIKSRSSTRDRIWLNVKALAEGHFRCGHFELKLDDSSVKKIVWSDVRSKGRRTSVWQREEGMSRSASRSRSPKQRQTCGCITIGRVVLRCVDHPPLAPPRSVLSDITTPGAWAPPVQMNEEMKQQQIEAADENVAPTVAKLPQSKTADKPSEVDQLLEAYDQSLENAALQEAKAKFMAKHSQETAASEAVAASPQALRMAKAKVLVRHFQIPPADKTEANKLVPEVLDDLQLQHSSSTSKSKANPRDPRLRRRGVVAPTGGA